MPYNFATDSLHTKKLCSRLSSSEVRFYTEIGRFAFLSPPLGHLGATYDDHLRLMGKRVVNFLLVLIVLCSLGVDPKFYVEGVAPTNHSSFQKTRINGLSYDVKILPNISIAWVGCTNVTDRRQTDGRTTTYSEGERERELSSRSLKNHSSIGLCIKSWDLGGATAATRMVVGGAWCNQWRVTVYSNSGDEQEWKWNHAEPRVKHPENVLMSQPLWKLLTIFYMHVCQKITSHTLYNFGTKEAWHVTDLLKFTKSIIISSSSSSNAAIPCSCFPA